MEMRDLWQSVQVEAPFEGAHGGLARLREALPVQVVRFQLHRQSNLEQTHVQ